MINPFDFVGQAGLLGIIILSVIVTLIAAITGERY
jgi:hypothetical protein